MVATTSPKTDKALRGKTDDYNAFIPGPRPDMLAATRTCCSSRRQSNAKPVEGLRQGRWFASAGVLGAKQGNSQSHGRRDQRSSRVPQEIRCRTRSGCDCNLTTARTKQALPEFSRAYQGTIIQVINGYQWSQDQWQWHLWERESQFW
jgi:hypothetical protein